MLPPLLAAASQFIFGSLMFVTSVFLILLVLVQRGRGGGLAGAFGGMGGQSAFGTKAGDLFTRVTMVVAGGWILLCILAIAVLNRDTTLFEGGGPFPGEVESGIGDDASSLPAAEGLGTSGLSLPTQLPDEAAVAEPAAEREPPAEPEPE